MQPKILHRSLRPNCQETKVSHFGPIARRGTGFSSHFSAGGIGTHSKGCSQSSRKWETSCLKSLLSRHMSHLGTASPLKFTQAAPFYVARFLESRLDSNWIEVYACLFFNTVSVALLFKIIHTYIHIAHSKLCTDLKMQLHYFVQQAAIGASLGMILSGIFKESTSSIKATMVARACSSAEKSQQTGSSIHRRTYHFSPTKNLAASAAQTRTS